MAKLSGEPSKIALAKSSASCELCHGFGRSAKRGVTCPCVYRGIFGECLERYHALAASDGRGRGCFIEVVHGHLTTTMKSSEYMADFDLAARRALDQAERQVLRLFFVENKTWRACALRSQVDKGTFFHAVYRTAQRMGQELARSGLWPLDEYFGAHRVHVQLPKCRGGGGAEVPQFHREALAAA